MAKVKIQGHASGTGVLTVTAPNTSTDRTITLPDSTGTLATTADVPAAVGGATGVDFNDNVKIRMGTDNDLEILHSVTQCNIDNGTGNLLLTSVGNIFLQKGSSEYLAKFNSDGAVELYHDNSKKLETQSGGLNIWGDIEMGGHFAFTGEGGSDRLTINENSGAVWIDGNCSAASFTDRTPYPETLQLAYDVINSHKKLPDGQYKADDQSKQLDHSNLHEYVSLTTPATLWTEDHNLPEGVSVGDIKKEEEKSRNMSGVISCLVEVVKDLSTKNTALEARITALES